MLYCDMSIDGTILWSGVQCLNKVTLNPMPYNGFAGTLYFNDTAGSNDPDYTGLTDRYQLVYLPGTDLSAAQQVPLQAIPNQTVSVALGTQNCTINVYTRTATMES